MPSCREVADDLNRNKKNRTFKELKAILESFGFREHERSGGSHRVFSKPGCRMNVPLKQKNPQLAAYVRKTAQAVEECCDE